MKAFISYSHRDESLLERFHTHLSMLRREGRITSWYDRQIAAGATIDREIDKQLESCQIFIALVSPDFLNSGYCYDREMARAIERHEAGQIVVIPVILEPCDWLTSPLKQFKAIPKDGKPISEWTNKNTAWLDVVTELRRLVESMQAEGTGHLPEPEVRSSNRSEPATRSKYRVKKTFDQVDREDFRRSAFEVIRDFFEKSCKEVDDVEGLRGRYESMGPGAFTCTVVNRMMKAGRDGTAHITVRAGAHSMLGDISWSFSSRASENTANGGLTVSSDDYHLFMRADFFSGTDDKREWAPEEAANRLWQDFIEQAGISYD
jgi:hypothetical protein